jgi:hypothetical protein
MKRLTIFAFLLVLLNGLCAEHSYNIGFAHIFSSSFYHNSPATLGKEQLYGIGMNFDSFTGKNIGFQFYSNIGASYVCTRTEGSSLAFIDFSNCDLNFVTQLIVCLAYNIDNIKPYSVIIGAGIGIDITAVILKKYYLTIPSIPFKYFGKLNYGPCATCTVSYSFPNNAAIYFSVSGMYDVLTRFLYPERNGADFSITPSIGYKGMFPK